MRTGLDAPPLMRAAGCKACRHTGFAGRLVVCETFVPDDLSRKAIAEGATAKQLRLDARQSGWDSITEDAREKVLSGKTTVAEVLRLRPEWLDA